MSGSRVTFVGNAMAAVVQGVARVEALIGRPPVVVGGLAVLTRLSSPYRATVDLDVVDRRRGGAAQLEILRAASGAEPVEPAAAVIPTAFGPVRVDVLEIREAEIERPSEDPGDRLHATAHAWANETASPVTIEVLLESGSRFHVDALVAEPGPLIAMKLQAVMNRSTAKQGTDLLDLVRLTLDRSAGPDARAQLAEVDSGMAADIALHVDLWFVRRRRQSLDLIKRSGGADIETDDIDLVAELLLGAVQRP